MHILFYFIFHFYFIYFFFSGFCHTLTWISHGCTCIPHPDPPSHLPLHPIPLGWMHILEEISKMNNLNFHFVLSLSVMSNSLWLWIIAQTPLSVVFLWQEPLSKLHVLLQDILPNQRLKPSLLCLLHCRRILYSLSHQEIFHFRKL